MRASGDRQCRGASSSSREQGAATDGAEAPSFVPLQSTSSRTSSRERVTPDDAKAPRHCRAIRDRPTAPDDLVIVARRGQPMAPRCRDTGNACHLRRRRGGRVIPRGKMRSIPNEAHNKRTRAVSDGGLRRRKVWLVMAAGVPPSSFSHFHVPMNAMLYQVMRTWIYCWFYEGKGTLGKVDPVLYYLMS